MPPPTQPPLIASVLGVDSPTGDQLLRGISLTVPARQSVAVMGPSGSGKTSLINVISGIAPVASGSVTVSGHRLESLPDKKMRALRLTHIGLVFQFVELLPELTVLENVALPNRLLGKSRTDAERAAKSWLSELGLENRGDERPAQLSGGEQQRVGIARALINEPSLVLADEPTGMLDEDSSARVLDVLLNATTDTGAGLLIVTHDISVADRTDVVLEVSHGSLTPKMAMPERDIAVTGHQP